MIPQELIAVAKRRAELELEDRRKSFAIEVANIRARLASMGGLYSSATIVQTREAVGREYRIRVDLIWHSLARALEAGWTPVTEGNKVQLVDHIRTLLLDLSPDLPEHLEKADSLLRDRSTNREKAGELAVAALSRVASEVDFAVIRQSRAAEGEAAGVVNVYQSYGIVQTGAQSTASLTVHMGAEERQQILLVLEQASEAIDRAPDLSNDAKQQGHELAEDVRAELERDRPNPHRLRGALQGLAAMVQTVASAPQAYGHLKGAAALVGLNLP